MATPSPFKSRFAFFVYGIVIACTAALGTTAIISQQALIPTINVNDDNVAIKGYDTVAYFTESKAARGSEQFEAEWEDARWWFSSAANRDLFEANPKRYAPQYGGYCAGGVAVGEFASVDPEAWKIVDGKLYLIHSKELYEVWDKAPKAHIDYAEYNWSQNKGKLRNNL
jgi:YHS domain-containing protein